MPNPLDQVGAWDKPKYRLSMIRALSQANIRITAPTAACHSGETDQREIRVDKKLKHNSAIQPVIKDC
jgi:hypothetical protein